MIIHFSKLLSILFALHLGILTVSAQKTLIAEEFLKIIPGVMTKQEIEKRFGPANLINDFMARYKTENFSLTVEYSTLGCDKGNVPWAMPRGIVERVTYWFPDEKRKSLNDVILKISKFTSEEEGDVGGHVTYRNRDRSIDITYSTNIKAVLSVTIEPTARQIKRFACRK